MLTADHLIACDRHQRPFTQRDRKNVSGAALCSDALSLDEERIATVEITAQDPRSPLQERSHRHREIRRREFARGLVGVGAHLFRPAAARDGPERGGHRLGVSVNGRAWVLTLARPNGLPGRAARERRWRS
jgi:hypothetical protein